MLNVFSPKHHIHFAFLIQSKSSNNAVIFDGLNADSTTDITSRSGNSFVLEYSIGRDKTYKLTYYVGDANCIFQDSTNIPFTIDEYVKPNTDPMLDSLRLVFRFNPDDIAGSNVYNDADQEIQICLSVTQDNSQVDPSGTLTVAKDVRLMRIPFVKHTVCARNSGTCTINPDPHFNIW